MWYDNEEQYYEEMNFTHTSLEQWDAEEARAIGEAHPERAWVLTDRDVWHPNPYYTGPKVPHPEFE